jgi:hypothetical protein
MIRVHEAAMVLLWLPVLLAQGQPPSKEGPGAKIWVGRNQEIEEYLRIGECMTIEKLGSGNAARCTLRPGGPFARLAWRSLEGVYRGFKESYKAEIAAYEVDKLLKMDLVPPTVERQLEGHKGAAQLWVEGVVDLKANPSPVEANRANWETQLTQMKMFDNLIGYRDRNTGNMLHDAAWHLILIDHSRAFGDGTEVLHKLNRIDGPLWSRIEGLTRPQLEAALGAWLDGPEIQAILDRREKMRADVKLLPR